jgi:hypothetical protein
MFLDARHAHASFILFVHTFGLCIDKAIHRVLCTRMTWSIAIFIFSSIAPHARPTPGASALALVVSSESVATSESTPAFGTNVWTFSGMKLRMSFQIVKSPEARLAGLAHVGFLLTMSEKVAFEVMVSCKLRGTVWAAVFFS